ncbi:MAG: C1 family peptidase, partial [Rubrivivax sp.]|nr:C1 family peptidase [Rubrivivax sp.]
MKHLIAVLALFTLAACGGGGGDTPPTPPPPPPEALFVTANAWTGTRPADAEVLTADEFRRRQVAGELVVSTATAQLDTRNTNRNRVEAERSFLAARADLRPDTVALLAQAAPARSLEAEASATLPDGRKVVFNELAVRIESAAASYRLARDPDNARATYAMSHALLSETLKAQVPAPASLAGATLEQIKTAARQMDTVLATLVDIDQTRLDPSASASTATPSGTKRALTAGNGVDAAGVCTSTGYANQFWFPLRNVVSPVKNQGSRGTCWAFAAVAAVESRERVQNDRATNVSEQFLVNKVKREWSANDFVDGGSAAGALNAAADRNQSLMGENGWTYNPATNRPANAFDAGVAGTAASYTGACT